MKFSTKDFFGKCDQIRSFLQIWSHLMKKSLMVNFIFCAVMVILNGDILNTSYYKQVVKFRLNWEKYVFRLMQLIV